MMNPIVRVGTLLALLSNAAAQPAPPTPMSNYSWPSNALGQHRILLQLSDDAASSSSPSSTAVWAKLNWHRRPIPNATTTDVIVTNAATGEVVYNAVRAPAGQGIGAAEALVIVFQPLHTIPAPPAPPSPPPSDGKWIVNDGTASASIVTGCSGSYDSGTACWKAVDGVLEFCATGRHEEGWDGAVAINNTEWIEFDLGQKIAVDALKLTTVGIHDDAHFPVHNPAECSFLYSESAAGPWKLLTSGTAEAAATCVHAPPVPHTARTLHPRHTCFCCC